MLHLPTSLLPSLLLLAPAAEGWLGIYLDGERTEPVVTEVIPGSPADKAGLRAGDELLAVGDQVTATRDAFIAAVRGKQAGDRLSIKLRRDGTEQIVVVRLGQRPDVAAPAQPPSATKPALPQAPVPGPEAGAIPARGYLGVGVRGSEDAVVIDRVLPGSPAEAAGMRVGEVVTTVNEVRIRKLEDLDAALAGAQAGKQVTVGLRSEKGSRSLLVKLGVRPAGATGEAAPRSGERAAPSVPPVPPSQARPEVNLEAELASLRAELAELRQQLEALRKGQDQARGKEQE